MKDESNIIKLSAGRWPNILLHFGFPEALLNNKHGPCPMCGGTDRFRFLNKEGDGHWICNQCGTGDGMSLLMAHLGCDFKTAREKLLPIVMGIHYTAHKRAPTGEERKRAMTNNAEIWKAGDKNSVTGVLHEYLHFRGLKPNEYDGADLKFHANLPYYNTDGVLEGSRMAMLARIVDREGKLACIHRTYLQRTEEGVFATFTTVKKITSPAREWSGGAIRLFSTEGRKHLIVAEGIETALSVRAQMYRETGKLIPCWAAINANNMEKMGLPEHITNVLVAADNDASYTGQAAAYKLANRLTVHDKRKVTVRVPAAAGTDFNDELRITT